MQFLEASENSSDMDITDIYYWYAACQLVDI